jgi:hypothetical protein
VDDSGEADAGSEGEGDGVEADSKAAAAVLGPAMEKGGVGSFDDAYKRASVGRSIWREGGKEIWWHVPLRISLSLADLQASSFELGAHHGPLSFRETRPLA